MRCLVLVAFAGCTSSSPNATLADLPGLSIEVLSNRMLDTDNDTRAPVEVSVALHYDHGAFRAVHGECAVVDIGGTFNGSSLDLVNAGHDDPDFGCISPQLRTTLQLGIADTGDLQLGDGSLTVTADYAAGTVAARIATAVSHPDWHFASNDQVVMRWSHPEDLALRPIGIWFSTGELVGFEITEIETAGDELRFTIPVTDRTGGRFIEIIAGKAGDAAAYGDATTCTGATRCTYNTLRAHRHTATLN